MLYFTDFPNSCCDDNMLCVTVIKAARWKETLRIISYNLASSIRVYGISLFSKI
jgi:hypothetical protein